LRRQAPTIVSVTVGKTEDLRIEDAISEVTVGDPDVADVTAADLPLAVDPRQEDRHPPACRSIPKARSRSAHRRRGVYDVSRLAGEIGLVAGPYQVVVGQWAHHASRDGAGSATLDRAVVPPAIRAGHQSIRWWSFAAAAGVARGALRRGHAAGKP